MVFERTLPDDCNEALSVIENNNRAANDIRNRITELQLSAVSDTERENINSVDMDLDEDSDDILDTESLDSSSLFEDEMSFYFDDYRNLDIDFKPEELIEILPVSSSYHYKSILMRLVAESIKEIKGMSEIMLEEDDSTQIAEIRNYIECEKKKINIINGLLKSKDSNVTSPESRVSNKIILAPSYTGNIRILDDLEHVSLDCCPMFRELIDSIINGTFKGVKRFTNNNVLMGICEVRNGQARILFQRLSKNTYALITAFVKKTQSDNGYRDFLKLRVTDYKLISDKLKTLMDNPEYMETNDDNLERLDRILGGSEKSPQYRKEAQ